MKRADELGERLRRLFDESKGRRWSLVDGPGEVVVEEKARDGLAEIRCRFPEGFRVIFWRHEARDFWPIASDKNADGAMLVVRPDGMLEAHVMECKQTVRAPAQIMEAGCYRMETSERACLFLAHDRRGGERPAEV